MIIALVAAIIIGREIAVSALREWMAELGARSRVAVSGIGKAKTTMQMIGLGCMLFTRDLMGLPDLRHRTGAADRRRGHHAVVHGRLHQGRLAAHQRT